MVQAQTAKASALQRLVRRFVAAFRELGHEASSAQFEEWSVLIHECMSGRGRRFHTVEHVFDISSGAPPLETLAILFHDAVYCQVDDGLPPRLQELLHDAVEIQDGPTYIMKPIAPEQTHTVMVARIFGFTAGQTLSPYAGLNEYLSAVLAVRSLHGALPPRLLGEIAVCIEATIPFRGNETNDPSLALAERLTSSNEEFSLGMSPEQQEEAISCAVKVANRDVGNFASEDARWFLDNTWKLLPETNNSLRGQRLYTISEYRSAMSKMEGFLGFLDPGCVFRQFRNEPTDEVYHQMRVRAEANILLGARYLRAKLLAASLLEALAYRTGGDAPISLFMGDLPIDQPTIRLESYLPPKPGHQATDIDEQVLDLLEKGRANDSGFDMKHSPLAAYLYLRVGQAECDRLSKVAKESLAAAEDPGLTYLEALPADAVRMVAEACTHLATTRAERLRAIAAGEGL
jgi:hypothetical protein